MTPALEKEERKAFYAYVLAATRKYEAILDIYEPYKVSVRKMSIFFDHQKGFHLLLRSAFPDYEKCRKKLLRLDYRWEGEKKE